MAKMLGNTHPSGYGGKNCACCYPPRSDYKKMNRSQKRREKRKARKEISQELFG